MRTLLLCAALAASCTSDDPPPCSCEFEDVGAAFNMPSPTSTCTNGLNQVLKCDDKIYVKSGTEVKTFDRVSCSSGLWYGTRCDGTHSTLNTAAVQVQCGTQAEPPLCPQLPDRGGLKYIGIVDGLQRYSCRGDEVVRLVVDPIGRGKVHGQYFDCNSTYYRASSSTGEFWSYPHQIAEVSCRDYGSLNQACTVPVSSNAWRIDRVIRCEKGYFPESVKYFDGAGVLKTLLYSTYSLSTASCAADGWTIAGTPARGVRLAAFDCFPTDNMVNSCPAITLTPRNVQYIAATNQYRCYNTVAEEMRVVTPTTEYYGSKLQCVSGTWQFTGSATVPIPASSTVSCSPFQMGVLPPNSLPLIQAGKTPEGLTRWTCVDSTVTLDLEYNPEIGAHLPVHANYIDCNNTHYRFSSSIDYHYVESGYKIMSVSCEDMGAKYSACSDPWDIGGVLIGSRYQCMKGYFLYSVLYIDDAGQKQTYAADVSDTKYMMCNRDGWQLQGTPLSGLRVAGFHCMDANPYTSYTNCAASELTFVLYSLKFDFFRKFYTCYRGQTLGYTLEGVRTLGPERKMICGTNAATSAPEWQWTKMDGSDPVKIPIGAKMNCFEKL